MSTTDDNEEIVRKGYAAFSAGDLDALAEVMSPDVVHLAPGSNQTSGEYPGATRCSVSTGSSSS